ncbi:Selenocysteine lyase/Cysteine desulfurase [Tistlia consotensis]|uniref:Selenocysteine lyase/Cysteine desulfurase n=1 Tax=Tistlia consotensis USBA 355 TaxID=560819 RepID=A0A1Y6C0K1_9PROT|nr:aminotransferase class V-fold PLP-dependent enzyme [Tistlia consotensis]SMF39191.1 Selenocysteine lyase/Cysteine desulfurase [Tistlia consotensis USBA 355]SNR36535.1 Selenocysteine lyase/Cysteine desulfurase [Tistlia consotensis]
MSIDVARARAETPGCAGVLHLNNAGAALMPAPVLAAQVGHLQREAQIGGYEAKAEAAGRLEAVYGSVAALIGARPEEIALVENATVAWDLAFYSFRFQAGDRILTAEAEYASNYLNYLRAARRWGVLVETVPSDAAGQLDVAALEAMIDERVRLIAVTHVPTNGGLVNPAEAIGKVARRHGIPYLLDACQSVGQLEVDVERIGCDLLSATGRKYLRGPRGTGFLYVRRAILERLDPPFLDLHSAEWVAPGRYELRPDARRFENWEFNIAGLLGLGAAVDYALDWGLPAIALRVAALAEELRAWLAEIPGVTLRDLGKRHCGLVTFTVEGHEAAALRDALRARAINVSVSDPRSTLLDATRRRLPDLLRASVHYYNDTDELGRFCAALRELVR